MTHVFEILAQQQQKEPTLWGQLSGFLPFILVMVVFLFLMSRSKRSQERQRQQMLVALKRGDRIQTIGGVLGTIVEVRDDEVVVKVDESTNAKIHFTRSAIHRVVESDKSQEKK